MILHLMRAPKQCAKLMIRVYQRLISPFFPPTCRFYPSCSAYAFHAMEHYGFLKGSWLTLKRLGRCHPFSKAQIIDPVPPHKQ